MDILDVARVCHETNRALAAFYGDTSQVAWEDTPEIIRKSVIDGVRQLWLYPDLTPEQLHEKWCKYKQEEGWTYAPTRDIETKTHPNLVEYDQLPPDQRIKDHVFRAIVSTLLDKPHV